MRVFIIMFVSLFCFDNSAMAQQYRFNDKGIGDIQIGMALQQVKNCLPLNTHSKKRKFILSNDGYTYYYIDEAAMKLENVGSIEEIIVTPDKSNNIVGIIIFVEDGTGLLQEKMIEALGNPSLASESSITGVKTTTKLFWKTASLTVFLTRNANKNKCEINIHPQKLEDNSPSVGIYTVY